MIVFYNIVEFFAGLIEIFIAYKVLEIIFTSKRIRVVGHSDVLLSAVATGIVLIFNNIKLFSFFTIVFVGMFISISILFLYRINFITAFSVTSFYLLCMNSFDFLMLTLISDFCSGSKTLALILNGMGPIRAVVIMLIKFLWVLVFVAIKKYLQKISVNIKGAYFVLGISGIGFCGFVFMANQAVIAFNHTMPIMWFVIICLLAAIVFIAYFMVMSRAERIQLEFLEMRNGLLTDNYNSLNQIYMSNSKLYHDLNNHLNVLYQLIGDENVIAAKEYIQKISEPIMSMSKTAWTGIDVVDVVINSKLHKMEELGITSEINVEFPRNSNMLPNDLCTILANLLDNAIEAAENVQDNKKISLIIRRVNYFLFIRITNPCKYIEKFDVFPVTTKENKTFHGWGLASVADAVKKYDGTIECINDKGEFIVKIMLIFDKAKIE